MNKTPLIVYVDNLKSSYKRTDADVTLALRNCNEAVTWYIDGTQISDSTFSPSQLAEGMHTIDFKTAGISGRVRVSITK